MTKRSTPYLGDKVEVNGQDCTIVEMQPGGDRSAVLLEYPNSRRVQWTFKELAAHRRSC